MARYFFGNTLAAFFRNDASIVESTTAGRFDSTFVSSSIQVAPSKYIQTMPFIGAASVTTLWIHAELWYDAAGGAQDLIYAVNSTGTQVIRLQASSTTATISYLGASGFVAIGTTFALSEATVHRLDIKLVAGVSGTIDVYLGGTLVVSASGLHANTDNFAAVRFYGSTNGVANWSQIMGADFDTRDSRYFCQLAVALGTKTQGSGAVSTINETVLDESTSISLATSTHERSFTHDTLSLPSGYQIGAVCIGGRGRINGSGPTDGKFGIYDITAATSYLSSALSLNYGYEPRGAIWETNPNTASDWDAAGYNDMEFLAAAA